MAKIMETKNETPQEKGRVESIRTYLVTSLTNSFRLYRQWWKVIALGIFIRCLTLTLVLFAASTNPLFPDTNDMNELLTNGLLFMFQGLNPYNRIYSLSALRMTPRDWYTQNFLNYGPMNLLIHVPCMIYPFSFDFAGFMDFQPSFMVLHMVFDFLLFDRLMRRGHRIAALFVWVNPILLVLNFVTHMSVVLFLLYLGLEQWRDPFKSIFWLGLGTITYQYIGLILLFAIAYHIRSYRRVLLGLLPSVLIFGAFQLWASLEAILYVDPSRHAALIHDLLLVQFYRPYVAWSDRLYCWWSWTGSIPAIVFNLYNLLFFPTFPTQYWLDPIQILTGNPTLRLSTIMSTVAFILTIILLIDVLRRRNYLRSITYGTIAILVFLMSTPAGLWHHNIIVMIPAFFTFVAFGGINWLKTKVMRSPK